MYGPLAFIAVVLRLPSRATCVVPHAVWLKVCRSLAHPSAAAVGLRFGRRSQEGFGSRQKLGLPDVAQGPAEAGKSKDVAEPA